MLPPRSPSNALVAAVMTLTLLLLPILIPHLILHPILALSPSLLRVTTRT